MSSSCNAVYLVEPADRFAKLVYLLANPVADYLVDRGSDWPGACSLGIHLSGATKTVKRPRGFFRSNGKMPNEVTLRIERPDGFEELSEETRSPPARDPQSGQARSALPPIRPECARAPTSSHQRSGLGARRRISSPTQVLVGTLRRGDASAAHRFRPPRPARDNIRRPSLRMGPGPSCRASLPPTTPRARQHSSTINSGPRCCHAVQDGSGPRCCRASDPCISEHSSSCSGMRRRRTLRGRS